MAIIPGEAQKNIVIDTPERQRTKRLVTVLVLVLILTGAVVYFGFFNKPEPVAPDQSGEAGVTSVRPVDESIRVLEGLRSTNLESPVFVNKKFKDLILSDRLPLTVGEKGRNDPFAPF